jgi:hypothetical protein
MAFSPYIRVDRWKFDAPVAQLDRASDFGSEGWGFESLRVYNTKGLKKRFQALFFALRSGMTQVAFVMAEKSFPR